MKLVEIIERRQASGKYTLFSLQFGSFYSWNNFIYRRERTLFDTILSNLSVSFFIILFIICSLADFLSLLILNYSYFILFICFITRRHKYIFIYIESNCQFSVEREIFIVHNYYSQTLLFIHIYLYPSFELIFLCLSFSFCSFFYCV